MDGVGKATAEKIRKYAIEGDYASFEHLKESLESKKEFTAVKWNTLDLDYAHANNGLAKSSKDQS